MTKEKQYIKNFQRIKSFKRKLKNGMSKEVKINPNHIYIEDWIEDEL